MTTGAAETPAVLHIANVRQVLAVLQAVRLRTGYKQQFCTLLLGTDGLSLRWEEESKALQSSVYLRPNVFARFECQDPRRVIGLNLGTLMDTLSVFASSTGHLEMTYPGQNGELLIETKEGFGGVEMSSYARINSLETAVLRDLGDYWEEPASYFLGPGHLLKEVVDDMEWAGNSIAVEVQRDPPRIEFASDGSSSGNGALRVSLPVDELPGFHCATSEVRYVYPLKRLQMAFTNLPAIKDPGCISTKVTMDARGIMKIAHMVNMQPGNAAQPHAGVGGASQGSGPVGIVQFMLLPEDGGEE
mmetsp:Transcript_6233/g.16084  ORF Transcript_6233/g.16084 Transcript_6233/m.16084 type:complete len:302 (-) Transcript_6233:288-1193(-)